MADIIDELAALDDAALSAKFGFDQKLADARKNLTELAALSGEARTAAVSRVTNLVNPSIYPDELGWIKRDAERKACKTAAQEMCDCSPSSIGYDD